MIISQNIGEGRFHVGKQMFMDVRRGRRPATFFSRDVCEATTCYDSNLTLRLDRKKPHINQVSEKRVGSVLTMLIF